MGGRSRLTPTIAHDGASRSKQYVLVNYLYLHTPTLPINGGAKRRPLQRDVGRPVDLSASADFR